MLESILRDPVMDFLEQRNVSLVDHDVANYGKAPQVKLPEPRENVQGPKGVDPERYKDIFVSPTRFRDAWNHPDEFQRKLWRAAIRKEFKKMEDLRFGE